MSRVGERRHDLETSGSQLATTRYSQHPAPPNGTDGAAQRHQIVLGCPQYRDAEEPMSGPAVARGPLQYWIGQAALASADDEQQIVREDVISQQFLGRQAHRAAHVTCKE